MSDENLFNKIASLVISLTALILAYLAVDAGYITSETFLLILIGILGAWGVTLVSFGVYKAGKAQAGPPLPPFDPAVLTRILDAMMQMKKMELQEKALERAKAGEEKK